MTACSLCHREQDFCCQNIGAAFPSTDPTKPVVRSTVVLPHLTSVVLKQVLPLSDKSAPCALCIHAHLTISMTLKQAEGPANAAALPGLTLHGICQKEDCGTVPTVPHISVSGKSVEGRRGRLGQAAA